MNNDILKLEELLTKENIAFGFCDYSKIYPYSNEVLSQILVNLPHGNKSFSVLSSGDQLFDIILNGYTNIDTFDCNKFTEYYALGLKKTAVNVLSYDEYLDFLNLNDYINTNYIYYLIPYMNKKYQEFWYTYLKLINKNNNTSLFYDMNNKMMNNYDFKYISNEENYNKLKMIINDVNISYRNNYFEHLELGKMKYDLIYLSNIFDYYNIMHKKCVEKMFDNNLEKNGKIIVVGTCPDLKDNNKKISYVTKDYWGYTDIYNKSNFEIRRIRNKNNASFLQGEKKIIGR